MKDTEQAFPVHPKKDNPSYWGPITLPFFLADGVDLFQGDIVMTTDIRDNLRSRGILVPGDDPSRLLPHGWGARPEKRPKRAIMRTNRGSDLRWLVGRSGKREVPYEITRSNGKVFFLSFFFFFIYLLSLFSYFYYFVNGGHIGGAKQ